MPLIRAVLFDYGLVLTGPPSSAAWDRMQKILKASDPHFHEAYWRPREDYDSGVLNGMRYWQTVADELGYQLTDSETDELIAADVDLWTVPNQPMIDWAAALQKSGITTGILSNLGDALEVGVLGRCPWLGHFSQLTFSHRLGFAKPDQRIYQAALASIGHPAHETLFVDDRTANVQAARRAGLNVIQYTGHEDFLCALEKAGIYGLPLPIGASVPSAS